MQKIKKFYREVNYVHLALTQGTKFYLARNKELGTSTRTDFYPHSKWAQIKQMPFKLDLMEPPSSETLT